jgi:heptosyltransferase-2
VELPTWLGDSVMTTPAIENILALNPKAKIIFFGSFVATELMKPHPNLEKIVIDHTKKSRFRAWNIYKLTQELGEFDLAISFRSHIFSKFLIHLINAKQKAIFNKKRFSLGHQVEKYNSFVNATLGSNLTPKDLKLYFEPESLHKPTLGINAGATYGDAKRWYPDRFAKVALELSNRFDIIIFGGERERAVCGEIEKIILAGGAKNVQNLAGETTISQLVSKIAGLELFITNDSGPMHIAGAYKIPTVSIFGPTKYKETSQWKNPNSIILRRDLECSPCMKRSCPIKTHECMKSILESDVLEAVKRLTKERT